MIKIKSTRFFTQKLHIKYNKEMYGKKIQKVAYHRSDGTRTEHVDSNVTIFYYTNCFNYLQYITGLQNANLSHKIISNLIVLRPPNNNVCTKKILLKSTKNTL